MSEIVRPQIEMVKAQELALVRKCIVLYGPTGGGKTTQFTTIKGNKLLFAFDPSSLSTVRGLPDLSVIEYPPEYPMGMRRTKKGSTDPRGVRYEEPVMYSKFETDLEYLLDSGELDKDFEAVCISSVTMLQPLVLSRLLWINGRFGTTPEIADYLSAGETILAIIKTLIAEFHGVVIVEGHSDLVQDEVSKKVQNQWDITKGVRRTIPRVASDVWVCEGNMDGKGNFQFSAQVTPSKEWPMCKNSFGKAGFLNLTLNPKVSREGQGLGELISQLK